MSNKIDGLKEHTSDNMVLETVFVQSLVQQGPSP